METTEIITQMMVQYQKKYKAVCELYRLTQELSDALSYNDQVSTKLILNMRHDEMGKADECSMAISVLEASMCEEDRHHLHEVLRDNRKADAFEEKKIYELYKNIQATLVKTISIDKRASLKIAGKDSYYNKDHR